MIYHIQYIIKFTMQYVFIVYLSPTALISYSLPQFLFQTLQAVLSTVQNSVLHDHMHDLLGAA
jgi:hypothetical protein